MIESKKIKLTLIIPLARMTNEKAVKALDLNLIVHCHNDDLRN